MSDDCDRAADTYSEHSLRVSRAIGKSSKIAKIVSWVSTVEGRPTGTRPLGKALPRERRPRRAAPALRPSRPSYRRRAGGGRCRLRLRADSSSESVKGQVRLGQVYYSAEV
jgi:hypothetical protein